MSSQHHQSPRSIINQDPDSLKNLDHEMIQNIAAQAVNQQHQNIIQNELLITANDLKKFRVAHTSRIKDNILIESVDFSPDGMTGLYNSNEGIACVTLCPDSPRENFHSVKKYGAGVCKFFNKSNMILHSSTKLDHHIRLFYPETKGYGRYFEGHEDFVTSIDVTKMYMNNFVSASVDNTVKLWDCHDSKCIRSQTFNKNPLVAFNPKEHELAVAYSIDNSTNGIYVMDIRNMRLDLNTMKFTLEHQDFKWTAIKYSKNGKYFMVNTNDNVTYIIDATNGRILHKLTGYSNRNCDSIETCFTPDSKFALGGGDDGKVHIWDLENGEKLTILDSPFEGSSRKIVFNPVLMCFATAGRKFHLWIEGQL